MAEMCLNFIIDISVNIKEVLLLAKADTVGCVTATTMLRLIKCAQENYLRIGRPCPFQNGKVCPPATSEAGARCQDKNVSSREDTFLSFR
jgi:hypothetical protein